MSVTIVILVNQVVQQTCQCTVFLFNVCFDLEYHTKVTWATAQPHEHLVGNIMTGLTLDT